MNINFLGGAREVGRSAILINDSLLLDYGLETSNPPRYPVGEIDPEAVVVSHGHLDHVGAVPSLLSGTARPPIHWTPPTRALALRLAEDTLKIHGNTPQCPFTETHVRRMTQVSETQMYGQPFQAAGHEVTLLNAGHIPGSAHVLVDDGETTLLYTGDIGPLDIDSRGQRLVTGTTARPDADVVITESTYATQEHDDRADVENRFVESIETTIWQGGTVIVPVFAIGRAQEIMLVCAANDIDCYLDGMATEVTGLVRQYPSFLRDPEALQRAKSNARFVTGKDGQRKRIADQNTVILTTAGMLGGGPVVSYIPHIRQNPTNKVALTGYQVDGTPGKELVDTGRAEFDGRVLPVSAQVEQYNFSAHADREELQSFLEPYESSKILVNHGDQCEQFATFLRQDGYEATAPPLAESIDT
ncbi:MBL fold metallo-hydrolase [Halovenus rubra]|uniref:MBL fold metallo-hydrolase n=2 Tax=Halovenus rubra TaxID=869890 RepID=A0ABD5X6X9_9EURY|nr:MBL fold metallo-hydrolase [Halovenus rubra]